MLYKQWVALGCLVLYVLVNNFAVILGRFPGVYQYEAVGRGVLIAQRQNLAPTMGSKPSRTRASCRSTK